MLMLEMARVIAVEQGLGNCPGGRRRQGSHMPADAPKYEAFRLLTGLILLAIFAMPPLL
jgi:hypothetical protein